jgi:hypothetical protein
MSVFSTLFYEIKERLRENTQKKKKKNMYPIKTNSTIWPICIRIFLTLHHYTAWVHKPWMGI